MFLRHTCPIECVGKGASDLAGFGGLVGGLGQRFDRQTCAKGGIDARRRVGHLGQFRLIVAEPGQVVGCLHGLVAVAQDALEGFVGLCRRCAAMAGSCKGRVQLAHFGAVFSGPLCRSRQAGKSCAAGRCHGFEAGLCCACQGLAQAQAGLFCLVGSVGKVVHLFGGFLGLVAGFAQVVPGLVCAVAQVLHLLAGLLGCLLVAFHFVFRGHDLTLERTQLLLGNLAPFKLLLHLLFGLFQRFQLFGRCLCSLAQHFLLLGQQFGIAGVQFKQLVDVAQLFG